MWNFFDPDYRPCWRWAWWLSDCAPWVRDSLSDSAGFVFPLFIALVLAFHPRKARTRLRFMLLSPLAIAAWAYAVLGGFPHSGTSEPQSMPPLVAVALVVSGLAWIPLRLRGAWAVGVSMAVVVLTSWWAWPERGMINGFVLSPLAACAALMALEGAPLKDDERGNAAVDQDGQQAT